VRTLKEKIYQVQQSLSAQYGAARVPIPPEEQKLVFAGNTLVDEALIADCRNLQKEATLHLTTKGRLQRPEYQPPVEAPAGASCGGVSGGVSGGDEHTSAASTTTIMRASLRLSPRDHFPEFDGSDGWAVVEGVDVSKAQKWYQTFQHETLGWKEWGGTGNSLMYLLNRCA
jgi:hypothetical protein